MLVYSVSPPQGPTQCLAPNGCLTEICVKKVPLRPRPELLEGEGGLMHLGVLASGIGSVSLGPIHGAGGLLWKQKGWWNAVERQDQKKGSKRMEVGKWAAGH